VVRIALEEGFDGGFVEEGWAGGLLDREADVCCRCAGDGGVVQGGSTGGC
jgi:hypothetical protein